MRVTIQVLNTALGTLETMNSRCQSLGDQVSGCVKKSKSNHKNNVLYPAKILSKIFIIFHFCLMKVVFCQWKCIHEILFVCRVYTKICINLSKFSSLEPFIYQFYDVINLVNTGINRRLSDS